jgi:hypothetical protein
VNPKIQKKAETLKYWAVFNLKATLQILLTAGNTNTFYRVGKCNENKIKRISSKHKLQKTDCH